MINPEKLTFKRLIMTIGNLPSSYVESLSYYECLLWLCNYLENTVIPAINNNAEALEEVQILFKELHDYVEHYFDNLDLQEEVNNKLDAMVEDGTFDEIINQELFSQLDAEINDSNYYNLNYVTGRKYNTDYYVVVIPKQIDSEDVPIYVAMDTTKTPLQYADDNYTTLTTNAGMTYQNAQEVWKQNLVIGNGEILNPVPVDITLPDFFTFLGFDDDRNVYEYQANTLTAQQALNDGVKNGYVVFYRYMNNGVIDETHSDASNWTVASPRLDIGIKANGDLVIFACDGRTENNVGMTNEEALDIMQQFNCVKAWRCDGGGSTSLNFKGSKINRNIDNDGVLDRKIDTTLNVKKNTINQERADIYSFIGQDRQLMNKQVRNDLIRRLQDAYSNLYFQESIDCLQIENNTANTIATSATWERLNLRGRYRHGTDISTIYDGSDAIGFTLNKGTLYKITVIVNFDTSTSGLKAVKITSGDNDALEFYQTISVEVPSTDKVYKQIICETYVNNNSADPKDIKLWKQGAVGDRFLRAVAICEEVGPAVS